MKRRSPYYIVAGIALLLIVLALALNEPEAKTVAQPTLYWGSRGAVLPYYRGNWLPGVIMMVE